METLTKPEIFAVGDRVTWRQPNLPEDWKDPFAKTLRDLLPGIHKDFGRGPFIVHATFPNPQEEEHPEHHPQLLLLKNEAGQLLPRANAPQDLSGEKFTKL